MAEDAPPSRRERRRAKRRERRLARGRRLITFRTLLFIILLGGVVVGALAAIRWYDTNSYFVKVKSNELIIYHAPAGQSSMLLIHGTADVSTMGPVIEGFQSQYLGSMTSLNGRSWHPGNDAGFFALGNRQTAGSLDGAEGFRTIVTHARHD